MSRFAEFLWALIRSANQFSTIEDDPEVRDARDFVVSIAPKEGVDYGWINDHAKNQFDRIAAIYKQLDDKASDIIKYLGGGTGLITLAALSNINHSNVLVIVGLAPSFVMAILAVFYASLARKPTDTLDLPDVRGAMDYADQYGDNARAEFLGRWQLAIEAMFVAVRRKSSRVELATYLYLTAIITLAVPVGLAIWINVRK